MSLAALRCDGCGGALAFPPGAAHPRCAFCGDDHLAPIETDPVDTPEGFIPFSVDAEAARALVRAHVTRSPWTPGVVRRAEDALVPVLVPAWSWSGVVETHWTALVEVPGRPGGEPRAGRMERDIRGVLIPSSEALSARELDGIAPFRREALRPLDATDTPWEVGSLTRLRAQAAGRAGMEAVVAEALRDQLQALRLRTAAVVRDPSGEALLLPVWIAAVPYAGRTYRVVVNGQSGRIVGELPRSRRRLAAALVLALGVVGLTALVVLLVFLGIFLARTRGHLSVF
jgi:LSD1 subclass zinc finger protein